MRSILMAVCAGALMMFGMSSCNKGETYADQKEKERHAISAFLGRDAVIMEDETDTLIHVGKINVISEAQFYQQDSTTNVEKNEYVLFNKSGVYMQIVSKGAGEKLKNGETKRIYCRYTEYNIMADSVQTTNNSFFWEPRPDIIEANNTSGTISGRFCMSQVGWGAMYTAYGDKSVPSGWLVPFTYINMGRQAASSPAISKVRLIVPHSQGQKDASSKVYPCFYEISYYEE